MKAIIKAIIATAVTLIIMSCVEWLIVYCSTNYTYASAIMCIFGVFVLISSCFMTFYKHFKNQ